MIINTDTEPRAGTYRLRLTAGAIAVPVRIFFDRPIVERRKLDRGARWQCVINGRLSDDITKAWPFCSGAPISLLEYRFLLKREAWARRHAPHHPAARPYDAINLDHLEPRF
jgi:hypothetical protein